MPIKITLKKVSKNSVLIWTIEMTSKKLRENNVEFATSEITPIKVRGNNEDFSTIKITSKKVCGNNVEFSTIEITLKKYAEMTWKFVEIWSSTWCARWDPPPFPCRIWNISSNQRSIFNHHQTTETTEKATAVRQQIKISNQKIKLFSYCNRERSYRNALRIL